MKLTKKQKSAKDTLAKVLVKAWEDETFKKQLIASPEAAISNFTGEKLPLKEGVKMVVIDESDMSTFYFNLPEKPVLEDIELNEDQLELVAGGDWDEAVATFNETGSIYAAILAYF